MAPKSGETGMIGGVGDTAYWTAGIRALEQAERAPAFSDEWAAVVAGAKGLAIARCLRRASELSWGVIVRTVSIDRLLTAAIAAGANTVLNLGAGLDTRPYRLKFPEGFRWIEIDLPHIVDYKHASCRDFIPACRIERYSLDLSNPREREHLRVHCDAADRSVIVLSEGLLPYLSSLDVAALASLLHQQASVIRWILDYDSTGGLSWAPRDRRALSAAPRLFNEPSLIAFLRQCGWEPAGCIGAGDEGARLRRPFPVRYPRRLFWQVMPRHWQEQIQNLSGTADLRKV